MLSDVFGIDEPLTAGNADAHYDSIAASLATDAFRPRALFERFNIEAIATTEGALDDLRWHKMIRDSGWTGKVITAYRPDAVVDPDFDGFHGQSRQARRHDRLRHRHAGTAISTPTARAAPTSRISVRPPPITVTRQPRRPTFPTAAAAELFDRVRSGKADDREKPRCSAPRC